MSTILIKNARIINEGLNQKGDLLIKGQLISAVGAPDSLEIPEDTKIIDAEGLVLIPGVIDEHVHFRDPGLTHKADILSESIAAAAGGVTSFMDMPNTVPQTVSLKAIEEKFRIGAEKSLINYSFYIGATNNNIEEILEADPCEICGVKVFMGSSTGNMLLDDDKALTRLFSSVKIPVAAHCEDEFLIKRNLELFTAKYRDGITAEMHPLIRSRDACFRSTLKAADLAMKFGTRLHILHISTADELKLLNNELPADRKNITAEVTVNHLWFDDTNYEKLGNAIKCNPAIKTRFDREALISSVNNDLTDVIATDHAPHTIEEKNNPYSEAPSGIPAIQHSLVAMLELWHGQRISLEKIVEKMCHNPAILFNISRRGFIREGYKADLCLFTPNRPWTVTKDNILYKCGWSPFENTTFKSRVVMTIVNGNIVYNEGAFDYAHRGEKLIFDRR